MNSQKDSVETKRQSVFVYVVIVIAVLSTAITWQLYKKIEVQQNKSLETSLETILKTTSGGLRLWANVIHGIASASLATPSINRPIFQNIEYYEKTDKLPPERLRSELDQALSPRIKSHNFVNYALLADDGTQIAGDSINLGTKNLRQKAAVSIEAAQKSGFSLSLPFYMNIALFRSRKPASSKIAMLAVVPVRNKSDKALASLVIYLDPTTRLDWLAHLAQLGQSGETFVVDRYGRMATQSRFENSATAQSLMHGRSGTNIQGYRGYRGVTVVGSWIWMDDLGFGVATEIDKREAYASYYTLEKLLALFALLSILGASTILIIRELQVEAVKANLALRLESDRARRETDKTRAELMTVIAHDLETSVKYYSIKYRNAETRLVR